MRGGGRWEVGGLCDCFKSSQWHRQRLQGGEGHMPPQILRVGRARGRHVHFWAAPTYNMRALMRPRGANYGKPENAWHLATCSQEKEDTIWQKVKSTHLVTLPGYEWKSFSSMVHSLSSCTPSLRPLSSRSIASLQLYPPNLKCFWRLWVELALYKDIFEGCITYSCTAHLPFVWHHGEHNCDTLSTVAEPTDSNLLHE